MKKVFFSVSLIIFTLFFTAISSYALTTNNENLDAIGNSVKNMIGGAENKVENAAKDASNATKNATNSLENMTLPADYNAERTAVQNNDSGNNFLNSTTWAWIIIAVIAIAIIAIFWYYTASQSKK